MIGALRACDIVHFGKRAVGSRKDFGCGGCEFKRDSGFARVELSRADFGRVTTIRFG